MLLGFDIEEAPYIWLERFSQFTTDAIKQGELNRAAEHLKLLSGLLEKAGAAMDDPRPKATDAATRLRAGVAVVVSATLGAVAGALAASRIPADKFAWTGLVLLPLFVLIEALLSRFVTVFGDRNTARLALAGALVAGFYVAWIAVRRL